MFFFEKKPGRGCLLHLLHVKQGVLTRIIKNKRHPIFTNRLPTPKITATDQKQQKIPRFCFLNSAVSAASLSGRIFSIFRRNTSWPALCKELADLLLLMSSGALELQHISATRRHHRNATKKNCCCQLLLFLVGVKYIYIYVICIIYI